MSELFFAFLAGVGLTAWCCDWSINYRHAKVDNRRKPKCCVYQGTTYRMVPVAKETGDE